MTMGQTDTLKFWVNSFRYINTIQLKEVIEDTDTVTYASIGRSILGDTTLSFRVNYLYSPKNSGNKNMLLFIKSADIYTRYYPFEILVKDPD
jgi:hypothetical protein